MSNDLHGDVLVLKTIADETRLRILGLLAERPRTGRELVEALGLSAPTISHHMKRLEEVGIVRVKADAQRRIYRLNDALLERVREDAPPAELPRDAYQTEIVKRFFDGPRLRSIPAKRKPRVAVLLELLRGFAPGRHYTEPEVNAVLRKAHEDVAFLRRELIDYRYLKREAGRYWVNSDEPIRDANEAQEVPSDERAWLKALIKETTTRPEPG